MSNLGSVDIKDFAEELRVDVAYWCPEILGVLTGVTPLASIPQDRIKRFPIEDIYRRWAMRGHWPKLLPALEDQCRHFGLIYNPAVRTYADGSGLVVGAGDLSALTPLSPTTDLATRDVDYELTRSILQHHNLPICFKSPGMVSSHPWVILVYETLNIVRAAELRHRIHIAARLPGIKRVVKAFVHDRFDFPWKPRVPYQYCPDVTQKMWFEQIAERMKQEFRATGYRTGSDVLHEYLTYGISAYANSPHYCGVRLDLAHQWADSVTQYIMAHQLPTGSTTMSDDGWVAKVDAVALTDLDQMAIYQRAADDAVTDEEADNYRRVEE